jgi:site-specific recombinase XerD
MIKPVKISICIRKDRVLSNGNNLLYIRYYNSIEKHKYFSTKIEVKAIYWDAQKQRVKSSMRIGHVQLNNRIRMWTTLYENELSNNPYISFDNLISKITDQPSIDTFLFCFEKFMTDLSLSKKYTISTLRSYKGVYVKCKKVWPRDINVSDFGADQMDRYYAFCLEEGIKKNSINRYIKTLKTVLRFAKANKIDVDDSALMYKLTNSYTERVFLTKEEVDRMQEYYDHTKSEKIKRVLRVFLFGCYTGLRFSDLIKLRQEDIKDNFIITKVTKSNTNKHTTIPIIPQARALIGDSNPIFSVVSNSTSNREIRAVGLLLGIHRHFTFHSSRHTFATLALNYGIPIEVVSKVLSHSKITTTQVYAQMLNETLEKEMEKFG